MKQAYKNVDTILQNAVSSINKKNGTCDISAISQCVSKSPANALLGWRSVGAPSRQGQKHTYSAGEC